MDGLNGRMAPFFTSFSPRVIGQLPLDASSPGEEKGEEWDGMGEGGRGGD